MIHKWRPWKCPIFKVPLSPCPSASKILAPPWLWGSNFKRTPPLQMMTNYMLSSPSLRSTFVFSINSLILSGFPLTSFHLAEDSLPAFSWLYTLVCAVVQKYQEMPFIYNYLHFSTQFAINLFYLHNLKT